MAEKVLFTEDDAAVEAFIKAETEIATTPLLDDIRLYLAEAAKPLRAAAAQRLPDHNLDKPFWAFAWTSGLAIGRYLLDHPQVVSGRRVMDFGCGAGHAGIAAKLAGAAEVVAYDIDPLACVAATMNAALNNVEITVLHEDPVPGPLGAFDVILAGDVFGSTEQAERYVPWFVFQSASGSDVIFADPMRDSFPELAARLLASHSVFNPFEPNEAGEKRGFVFRVPPVEIQAKPKSDPPAADPSGEDAEAQSGELVTLTKEKARHLVETCGQIVHHPLVPELRFHAAANTIRLRKHLAAEFEGVLPPGHYWAFPWACGQALVKLIHDEPERVRGKRVLDFGCGNGQVAIAAALAGAKSVEAIDIDPLACMATQLNAALNGVRLQVSDRDILDDEPGEWDVVVAGDVFYENYASSGVAAWFRRLADAEVEVLLADNGRPEFPPSAFERVGGMTVEPWYALLDSDLGEVRFWRALRQPRKGNGQI